MQDLFEPACPCAASFLWINLTREVRTALGASACGAFDVRCVREPGQIQATIERHAPNFLCFEFDEPDTPGINALATTRHAHPGLPVLMITGCHSEPLVLWALRIRMWDLLVKPVLIGELSRRITTLDDLTRHRRSGPARDIRFPQQATLSLSTSEKPVSEGRTQPAVLHVASHFNCPIALERVASLCQLSPTQFCRVFRQENGASFVQHLVSYRLVAGLQAPGPLQSTRQGGRLLRRFQRSFVFHPRLQARIWRLSKRLPGGRKIVLVNGRIVLTHRHDARQMEP